MGLIKNTSVSNIFFMGYIGAGKIVMDKITNKPVLTFNPYWFILQLYVTS